GVVGDREANDDRRAELNAIAVLDLLALDALRADERAVRGAEVFDEVTTVSAARDARVATAHAAVFDPEIRFGAAADHVLGAVEREDLARVHAGEDRERCAVLVSGRGDGEDGVGRAITRDVTDVPRTVGRRRAGERAGRTRARRG